LKNFYDGWTDRQEENRRRETIQHTKGQTYLFSGLLKCHLKISYQTNKIFGQSLDLRFDGTWERVTEAEMEK
jgi:hypothetical protein